MPNSTTSLYSEQSYAPLSEESVDSDVTYITEIPQSETQSNLEDHRSLGDDLDEENPFNCYQSLAACGLGLFYWTLVYPLFFLQQELVDAFDSGEAIQQIANAIEELQGQQAEMEEGEADLTESLLYFYIGLAISFLSSLMLTLVVRHYKNAQHDHHHEEEEEEEILEDEDSSSHEELPIPEGTSPSLTQAEIEIPVDSNEGVPETPLAEGAPSDAPLTDLEGQTGLISNKTKQTKSSKHHDHSWCGHLFHEITHYATIGLPFALIGSSAAIDIIWNIDPDTSLKITVPIAVLVGALAAWGAKTVHSSFVDEGHHSHGGGYFGFIKALGDTFIFKISGLNNLWDKYGIVLGHAAEGYFAAYLFTSITGLDQYKTFDILLKTLLPIGITTFEGFTEASLIDKQKDNPTPSTIHWSKAFTCKKQGEFLKELIVQTPLTSIKILASTLHAIPVVLGGTEILNLLWKHFLKELVGDNIYGVTVNNGFVSLAFLGISALVLLKPNARGFYSLIDEPVQKTIEEITDMVKQAFSLCCGSERKEKTPSALTNCQFSSIFCCNKKPSVDTTMAPTEGLTSLKKSLSYGSMPG